MIDKIRPMLEAVPFQSFVIITSSGHRYHVPTRDHASIDPRGTRILVWFDEGGDVVVSALHVVAVERETSASTQSA